MNQQHPHSNLFTLRIWQEKLDHDHTEWRGRIQHVLSGDTRHFRDWPALREHLLEMLQTLEADPDGSEASKKHEGTEGKENR